MRTEFIGRRIDYDGSQLRSHWAYREFGFPGDIAVAFTGACDVDLSRMVDLADVKKNAPIKSRNMLHFIVEHFDHDLERAILRQLILVSIAAEKLMSLGKKVERRGNDIYSGKRKLSVSIATLTPVSSVCHLGLNISSSGVPVRAIGLDDLRVNARKFAEYVLSRYAEEIKGAVISRCKVRCVQ